MTNVAKAYNSFWSSILPAYVEHTVPEDTPLPYITYNLQYTAFAIEGLHQVRIWTRSKSFKSLSEYCDKVHKLIPESGTTIYLPDNKGCIYLYRGAPFIQNLPAETVDIKSAYINITAKTFIY